MILLRHGSHVMMGCRLVFLCVDLHSIRDRDAWGSWSMGEWGIAPYCGVELCVMCYALCVMCTVIYSDE